MNDSGSDGSTLNNEMQLAKWQCHQRDKFNHAITVGAIIAALFSCIVALYYNLVETTPNCPLPYLIIGFWVLAPPVYFWLDWHVLCAKIPAQHVESVKHIHDLSRNIWIALISVLSALFGIGPFA